MMLSYLSLQGPQRLMMTMCKVVRMRRRMLCLLKNSHQTNGSSMKCQGGTMSLSLGFQVQGIHCHQTLLSLMLLLFLLVYCCNFWACCARAQYCTPMPKLKLSKLNQTRRVAHGHPHVPLSWKLGLQQYCVDLFFLPFIDKVPMEKKAVLKRFRESFFFWERIQFKSSLTWLIPGSQTRGLRASCGPPDPEVFVRPV